MLYYNYHIFTDACGNGFIFIPNLSPDGIVPLAIPDSNFEFISTVCGGAFGIDGKAVPLALVSKFLNKSVERFLKHENIVQHVTSHL